MPLQASCLRLVLPFKDGFFVFLQRINTHSSMRLSGSCPCAGVWRAFAASVAMHDMHPCLYRHPLGLDCLHVLTHLKIPCRNTRNHRHPGPMVLRHQHKAEAPRLVQRGKT